MTKTPINIFTSDVSVDSTSVDRLEADVYQRDQWSSWLGNGLCLLWQEVLHA